MSEPIKAGDMAVVIDATPANLGLVVEVIAYYPPREPFKANPNDPHWHTVNWAGWLCASKAKPFELQDSTGGMNTLERCVVPAEALKPIRGLPVKHEEETHA